METVKRPQWLPGKGVEIVRWTGRAQRILRAVKILCMILQWWTRVIIPLSKPTECTTPRVNPKINYGLSVILMCQSVFILGNKYTILVSDLYNQGGYACVFIGGLRKSCVPLSQFCCKPKTALKPGLFKKCMSVYIYLPINKLYI